MAKIATLEEIETHWTVDDLYDALEALDVLDEMQGFAEKKAMRESGR